MKYLLDTNIVIDHIRGKIAVEQKLLEKGSFISIITLSELYYGVFKSVDPQKSYTAVQEVLTSLGLEVADLTEDIVLEFGKIKASLEKSGERLEDFDLLIAATAKISNLVLVTRNTKHFKRIKGLKLYY